MPRPEYSHEERVKLLESYCFCPSYQHPPEGEAKEHGKHPKCQECWCWIGEPTINLPRAERR